MFRMVAENLSFVDYFGTWNWRSYEFLKDMLKGFIIILIFVAYPISRIRFVSN
jgi:hypothetical protein